MLPRWHAFWGAIFSILLFVFLNVEWYYAVLVFLASVFIDIDHYLTAVIYTKKWSLQNSFDFWDKFNKEEEKRIKKGIRQKSPFNSLHTIEFHLFVLIVGFFYEPVLYIFIGMLFHSLLDLGYLIYHDSLYVREYVFLNWARERKNKRKK